MIAIFDSGIGGLTVAAALQKQAPQADFVYVGDLAHAPFGPKSQDELFGITLKAIQFLRSQGADEIVAACNSVSVSVIRPMMEAFGMTDTHMIEMVGPTVRTLAHLQPKKILVLATEATVRSGMYEQAFQSFGLEAQSFAIPTLASAIEEERRVQEIQTIIEPAIKKAIEIQADTLVFGCTHYPFVKDVFENRFTSLGVPMHLFDPSHAVAQEVLSKFFVNGRGEHKFYTSKSSSVFSETVKRLFGDDADIQEIKNHPR